MSGYFKTFLRGSAVSLLGTGIFGIVNYLIRRTLCLDLSLADYGSFYGTFALLSMIFGFTDLGLTQTGTLLIAASADDPEKRDRVFSHLFLMKGSLAILCALGILIWQIFFPDRNLIFLLLFLGYFVGQSLAGTLQSLWGGQKKYSVQQAALISIALLTFGSLMLTGKLTLTTAAGCFLFPVVLVLLIGLICSRIFGFGTLCFRRDPEVFRNLLTMGGVVAVTTTLLSMMYFMDTIMLEHLSGPESAGLYNVALPIMQMVQAAMIFPAVFLPIAVDMGKHQEYRKLQTFVRCALGIALAALLPVGFFFHFSGAWLIRFLFKAEYVSAAPAVTVLCLGLVFFTLGNFLFQIMLSLKKAGVMAGIAAVSALGNLCLNYFLIRRDGVNGAAFATLASYLIFSVLTYAALEYNLERIQKS